MAQFRVEKDSLGEKNVPIDSYFGIQTVRALENFPITGLKINPNMIKALAIIKKSAALANFETGKLPEKIASAIIKACDEILSEKLLDQFCTDPIQGGAGTSINMNANEIIANRALELLGEHKGNYDIISPNDHVNMAQSTNDVFPTAIHLSALFLLKELLGKLQLLAKTLDKKGEQFSGIIKMGRTHLQDAVPILLGQEFQAYASAIKRDVKRISTVFQELLSINMGATAVGTGLNADPNYIDLVVKHIAKFSDLDVNRVENLVDGTQNTDVYVELSSMLKICMLSLSKISNDIRLMASGPICGLYELKLPERQPGSSIMPGKVNPVMAEAVNQVAFAVAGNDLTVSMACEAGQFELNVMEPIIAYKLIDSISIMTNVIEVFCKYLLEDLQPNIEKMSSYVKNSVGIVTALNPHIGYKLASKIAKEALATGKTVEQLVLEQKILSADVLNEILNPKEMTKPGIPASHLLKK